MLPGSLRQFVFCLITAVLLAGCNLPMPTPTPPSVSDRTDSSPASTGAIHFVNPIDGGSIEGSYDEQGRARVMVQVRVSGISALAVSLDANGIGVLDEATNLEGVDPFLAEIPWYPINGGGEYTLVASVILDDKSVIQQTARITVTGIPVFTPTPPPPDQAGAQRRISELIQMEHGVSIPLPAVVRFDDPYHPYLSRWIGSAYYKGRYYYVDLYDDTHYLWSGGPYSDRPNTSDLYTFCKPAGHYTVLVLFVDYNNLLRDPSAAVAAVPRVVDWLNGLYVDFARSQSLSSPPLSIEAEAAFVGPPPSPGESLTATQIHALTGKDPADYDILIEIDIDPRASFAARHFPGLVESGGGLAMQGCGLRYKESINIWSSLPDDAEIEGALIMDFNHELSHLFGMQDNWPTPPRSIPGPSGQNVNDWIPYPMFGWTDADGDGVIEITDPTPYGTNGPEP